MRLRRVLPAGSPVSPESVYTGLDLAARAPAERPHVICNLVASADGKGTVGGRSGALGGAGDRRVFHLLRTQVDAVLAGTGTLRVERYGPLVRDPALVEVRAREGRAPQPLAVVVSRSGDVPAEIPLFADPGSRVALYLPPGVAPPDCAAELTVHALAAAPRPVAPAVREESGREAASGLASVLRSLRTEHGVRVLLCEGGARMMGALIADGLLDELFLTLAPALAGGEELGLSTGPRPPAALALELVWALEHENDLFLRYARRRPPA